jgi:hypothetical protein
MLIHRNSKTGKRANSSNMRSITRHTPSNPSSIRVRRLPLLATPLLRLLPLDKLGRGLWQNMYRALNKT